MDVRHLLLDLSFEDRTVLERVEPLWGLLCAATEATGATILHRYAHPFEPHGMSGFLLLAESHVSIHTWPEERYAALDILSCGPLDPEEVARRFMAHLPVEVARSALYPRGQFRPPRVSVGGRPNRLQAAHSPRATCAPGTR